MCHLPVIVSRRIHSDDSIRICHVPSVVHLPPDFRPISLAANPPILSPSGYHVPEVHPLPPPSSLNKSYIYTKAAPPSLTHSLCSPLPRSIWKSLTLKSYAYRHAPPPPCCHRTRRTGQTAPHLPTCTASIRPGPACSSLVSRHARIHTFLILFSSMLPMTTALLLLTLLALQVS